MDFSYNKEQKMYQDSARDFFVKECSFDLLREIFSTEQGYSKEHWNKIAHLGWTGMIIGEEYNGIGGTFLDFCPIIEEMGRSMFPGPFLHTAVLAATLISKEGDERIKKKILPLISDGKTIVSIAVGETGNESAPEDIKTTAKKTDDGYILNGSKLFVPYAHVSDYIICLASDESVPGGGLTLFMVDGNSRGLECTPIPTFSIDKYSKVDFKEVKTKQGDIIGVPGMGWEAAEKLLTLAAASACVQMIGGMEKVLEMTVDWVKNRKQFGVPIGSFQAIQHHCAEMSIDVESSKYITYQAACKLSKTLNAQREVSMAKSWTGDAYQRLTATAIQVHGAMGFTEEYNLHYYYKQAKSLQLMHGDSRYHRQKVAKDSGY